MRACTCYRAARTRLSLGEGADLGQVVHGTRKLGEVLVRHDEQWLYEGDSLFVERGSWGTAAIRQGESSRLEEGAGEDGEAGP